MSVTTALIVEDDRTLSTVFSRALSDMGYATKILSDGGKVMAYIYEHHPDLLVLDLHLPTVSGESILQSIKQDASLHDMRIILATADGVLGEQLREQADLVLIKPISVRQLQLLANRIKPAR